jgi:hypothetical protein
MPVLQDENSTSMGSIFVKNDINPSGVTIQQPQASTRLYRVGTGRRKRPLVRDNTPYTYESIQARAPSGNAANRKGSRTTWKRLDGLRLVGGTDWRVGRRTLLLHHVGGRKPAARGPKEPDHESGGRARNPRQRSLQKPERTILRRRTTEQHANRGRESESFGGCLRAESGGKRARLTRRKRFRAG